jgi:hypothetical protein
MALRFEFDRVNKILLGRLDGRLSDEALGEAYETARKHAVATDCRGGIWDMSSVTEFAVSGAFIRFLASREPVIADTERPRVIVASQTHAFGLFRMFQLAGERTRPRLTIVHTMDEALAELGIQSPHFEPLQWPLKATVSKSADGRVATVPLGREQTLPNKNEEPT